MKHLFMALVLALMATFAGAAFAEDVPSAAALRPAKHENICMVNNTAFDKPQIPTVVEDKTYYGCCEMCKERLEKDAAVRKAVDPVSGREVDKADATIGVAPDGKVYYFENEENMKTFKF